MTESPVMGKNRDFLLLYKTNCCYCLQRQRSVMHKNAALGITERCLARARKAGAKQPLGACFNKNTIFEKKTCIFEKIRYNKICAKHKPE